MKHNAADCHSSKCQGDKSEPDKQTSSPLSVSSTLNQSIQYRFLCSAGLLSLESKSTHLLPPLMSTLPYMSSLKADSLSPAVAVAAVGFAFRSSTPPWCYQTPWNTWPWHFNSISNTIFNRVWIGKCLIQTTLPGSKQISACIIKCISSFWAWDLR